MTRITLILAALLILSGVGHYLQWEHARATQARVAPLQDMARDAAKKADSAIQALARCEAEKLRLRRDNERAIDKAAKEKRDAATAREDFDRRRVNAPADCDEIRKARVCRALMDY